MKTKLLTICVGILFPITGLFAQASDLFISEYIEGSSYNKAIEIYNGTGSDVDLSAYTLQKGTNGADWSVTATLSGTLSNGDVYIVFNSQAGSDITNAGDLDDGVANFNGDDPVGLFKNDVLIDIIGVANTTDPGDGWEVAGVAIATKDHTLVRKSSISAGNTNWSASAGTTTENSEWIVYDKDEFSYIGSHTMEGGAASTQANITSFTVEGQQGETTINVSTQVIDFNMAKETALTALIPTIEISAGAEISPASGVVQDFSDTVVYTVTAEDTETQKVWKVVAHTVIQEFVLFEDDFEDGTLDKWSTVMVTGNYNWAMDETHGVDGSKCAKASGYDGGANETEMWLIASSIDLTSVNSKILSFYTAYNYDGNVLEVKYSTDYTSGDPSTGTWVAIEDAILSSGGWEWTNSGEIDLSDINSNNFSIAFIYSSTSSAASTWELDNVTIKGTNDLSPNAEIIALSFPEEVETAVIKSDSALVRSVIAYDADITELTPSISVSAGAQVTPTTADFSSPIVYTVAAEDGVTTKDWTIYVTKEDAPVITSIYEIQYTDSASGNSPYLGQMVQTTGIVTGISADGFYIQDSAKAWNGVYVYRGTTGLTVGDSVMVTADVDEYFNLTELKNPEVEVIESGKELPAPITIGLGDFDELYEGVLVTVEDLECYSPSDSHYEWTVIDGNGGAVIIGGEMVEYEAPEGSIYESVTGVATYTFSKWKVQPRNEDDIIRTLRTDNDILTFSFSEQYSDAVINSTDYTVAIEVVEGTNVTALTPTITVSAGAQVTPTTADFTSPVTYSVVAEDGMAQDWTVTVTVHVGVNVDNFANISLFPNPCTDRLTIANIEGVNSIFVSDIIGRKVKNIQVNSEQVELNMQDLNKGIYLITFINENGEQYSERIVRK